MKIISAAEAAKLIKDNDVVTFSGFGSYAAPDYIMQAIADRYHEEKSPRNLTTLSGICTGDNSENKVGLNRLSEDGLITTLIAAHYKNPMTLEKSVGENKFAAYTIPLGVMVQLFRSKANRQPGVLTKVGINTYVDPRNDGPAANEKAKEKGLQLVSVQNIENEEYLFYKIPDINVAVVRGSYADEKGNISIVEEGLSDIQFETAVAAHNAGGIVIAQVEKIVKEGTIPAKQVRLHHKMVDYIVVCDDKNYHMQSYANTYRPEVSGEIKCTVDAIKPLPLSIRKVIARRATMELKKDNVINLGIGIPSGVGSVANEEGLANQLTLSLESGPMGGVPVEGVGFAGSVNAEMIANIADILDFYDGGGLDMAVLGMAEVDSEGNVNVSKFNGRCAGPGGFIDITQNTHKVCFVGSFTAGKSQIEVGDGTLNIVEDGKGKKFVEHVQQITFSAKYARETNQEIYYITERAVFKMTDTGIALIEVAPGVDVEKDILANMEFKPQIAENIKIMDERLFKEEKMGLTL